MYTLYLVDDEPWALKSLLSVLDVSAHNFTVAGKFTDALAAWEAIEACPPDVAFVDIRMPEMSGLQIAHAASDAGLKTLFVIVSGYGEFSYAQEAIRSGVYDYCLKPLGRQDAARLMQRLKGVLDTRSAAENAALCEEILSGAGARRLFARQGIAAEGEQWQALIFRFVDAVSLAGIQTMLADFAHLTIWLGDTKLLAVVNGDAALPAQVEKAVRGLAAHPRLLIGVSRPTRHPEHLASRISQARDCAYHDFINPDLRLVFFHPEENVRHAQLVTGLTEAIAQGNAARFGARLNDVTPLLLAEGIQMAELVRAWNDLMLAFRRYMGEGSDQLAELPLLTDAEELRAFLEDLPTMIAYLRALMARIAGGDALRTSAVNESFLGMIDYVREHCCERLKLADLADRFHLNMAYASDLFRRVVGETYTEYLTRLRMERAQEMILAGKTSLQAVALSVGYGDYFAFSKRFKQYFGVSPSQVMERN